MYGSGAAAGSRHPQHHSSRRSSHHEKERAKKHRRESAREKIDPFFVTSPGNGDDHAIIDTIGGLGSPTSEIPRGGGGGFEMGVVSGSMMADDEESSNWFLHDNSSLQTTPIVPPTFMPISTAALATPMNECGRCGTRLITYHIPSGGGIFLRGVAYTHHTPLSQRYHSWGR